jgi:hypothetical protein
LNGILIVWLDRSHCGRNYKDRSSAEQLMTMPFLLSDEDDQDDASAEKN